ncbi:MAG: hypothetical protein HRT44_13720 [Bdellovibrionales bacterium]|nr:hypothetical protein [Bdellovibrionales bacterium]NQZ20296.1 hypothetical protein [Bdellovibrionales bacterium]
MKKMGDIMKELGFNPEGSDEVKKAFIKNLIQQAQVTEFSRQQEKKKNEPKDKEADKFEQLDLFSMTKISG